MLNVSSLWDTAHCRAGVFICNRPHRCQISSDAGGRLRTIPEPYKCESPYDAFNDLQCFRASRRTVLATCLSASIIRLD